MNNLVWMPVKGYEGVYEVSNKGDIRGLARWIKNNNSYIIYGEATKSPRNVRGYMRIGLWKAQVRKGYFVHRLVSQAFIPNPENKPFINHKNGIKSDNTVENLEWVTQSENEIHAHKTGLKNHKGEKSPASKLTQSQVEDIKESISKGTKLTTLAHMYSVSVPCISNIKKGKTWNATTQAATL